MTFASGDMQYRIGFTHEESRCWRAHIGHILKILSGGAIQCLDCTRPEGAPFLLARKQRDLTRATRCQIHVRDGLGIWCAIAEGSARPHPRTRKCPGDLFTREGGRHAALTKALESRTFTRDFRAAAWQAYNNRAVIAKQSASPAETARGGS